ncbi:MAG TPA: EamA family transporter RarD [Chloroflexi bacterium]|nr:EamA family transporter RarD [Chloroflexota bacterium]
MNTGILAAVIAYTLWGLLPIYWKALQTVPALEIMCHRAVWSALFLLLALTLRRRWEWTALVRKSRRTQTTFLVTAGLLSVNWFLYIWAVNTGHVVDASLGYFINPLLSVLLGLLFLAEKLRPWQWVAIGVAALGVVYLTLGYGAFPWIALTLALTFGIYGLLRKIASLESLEGLALETTLMSVPALIYLISLELAGQALFGHADAVTNVLLALSGVATALPLLLFAYAARRITLATVGILQYLAPTGQFLLGTLAYREPFTPARLVGFSVIWTALLIYSLEGVLQARKQRINRP